MVSSSWTTPPPRHSVRVRSIRAVSAPANPCPPGAGVRGSPVYLALGAETPATVKGNLWPPGPVPFPLQPWPPGPPALRPPGSLWPPGPLAPRAWPVPFVLGFSPVRRRLRCRPWNGPVETNKQTKNQTRFGSENGLMAQAPPSARGSHLGEDPGPRGGPDTMEIHPEPGKPSDDQSAKWAAEP